MLRFGTVVLNVHDLGRAAAFWSAALGYEPVKPPEDDWATLGPRAGGAGPWISLQLSDQDAPDVPHVHLDLFADDAADQAAQVERLVALGATRADWDHYPEGERDFIVLSDTEGNLFCIIDTSFGAA
jgi:catechol 2,3-dioxygenase-like lactoylglutathione lyase family enzyme